MLGNVQSSSMVLTGNSMGSSEIWDKYHSCCIENGNFNAILVVFIPNFTATHAITSTYRTLRGQDQSKKCALLFIKHAFQPTVLY